jgi:chemotaxis receptor (MCP) glutamine deamidase CheD
MAGRYPPPFLNTQEDRGAIVTVVSFTFVVVSTLTNCIRVAVRQQSERALGLDDALLVAANVSKIQRARSRHDTDLAAICRP